MGTELHCLHFILFWTWIACQNQSIKDSENSRRRGHAHLSGRMCVWGKKNINPNLMKTEEAEASGNVSECLKWPCWLILTLLQHESNRLENDVRSRLVVHTAFISEKMPSFSQDFSQALIIYFIEKERDLLTKDNESLHIHRLVNYSIFCNSYVRWRVWML